jgi:hypothetical protein
MGKSKVICYEATQVSSQKFVGLFEVFNLLKYFYKIWEVKC